MNPNAVGWEEAYAKAREIVSQMTLLEKVNITTGTGWQSDKCVGNTGSVPRLGIRSLCLQDSPLGKPPPARERWSGPAPHPPLDAPLSPAPPFPASE